MRPRIVELNGAFNVRDLGGLRTADGRLTRMGVVYRGDSLDHITRADVNKLITTLNVREIIDLRTFEEVEAFQDPHGLQYRHQIPLIAEGRIGREPFPSEDPEKLAAVYLENIGSGSRAVRTIFELISDATQRSEACIFHCAAGRDRTGVIAALLLDFLGVRREEIAADYELSNHHARSVTKKLNASPLYANSSIKGKEIIRLRAATILTFLQLVDSMYGGTKLYLLETGIPEDQLSQLSGELLIAS